MEKIYQLKISSSQLKLIKSTLKYCRVEKVLTNDLDLMAKILLQSLKYDIEEYNPSCCCDPTTCEACEVCNPERFAEYNANSLL